MAKWDDPIGQIKAGAEEPPKNPGTEVAGRMVSWIPVIGKTIEKALNAIRGQEKEARLQFLLTAIVEQLEVHEENIDDVLRRLDQAEFSRLMSVTIERIFFGANERKVKRFVAVIINAAINERTEQEYEDAVSFIRALDELSEDDIKVLKHLYSHQSHRVNEQHAMTYNEFFQGKEMVNMLADARNLGMQMDEFYSRLNRLTGYGLAIQLDKSHGSMGNPDDFAFRMTLLGKRLIDMLHKAGETIQVTKRTPGMM
jgi:hypothetical protein